MDFKRTIHKPKYFGGKSSDDIEKNWGDSNSKWIGRHGKINNITVIFNWFSGKFVQILKIRNENLTRDVLKLPLKEKFTDIGNKNLLRAQIIKRKLKEGETLNEYIINITQLCFKVNRNMTDEEICEKYWKVYQMKCMTKLDFKIIIQ